MTSERWCSRILNRLLPIHSTRGFRPPLPEQPTSRARRATGTFRHDSACPWPAPSRRPMPSFPIWTGSASSPRCRAVRLFTCCSTTM
ncbi:hypothetical protein OF83DRAFT_1152746 [Amylostereum chailletii]|nr:hypothetical protein OF83DRAFT_1152746 [Amylostereum chailletii]